MPDKLESIFIETVCPTSSNKIIECIYKHLSLQVNGFTNEIILSLSDKLDEVKNSNKIFLFGNYNTDLPQ